MKKTAIVRGKDGRRYRFSTCDATMVECKDADGREYWGSASPEDVTVGFAALVAAVHPGADGSPVCLSSLPDYQMFLGEAADAAGCPGSPTWGEVMDRIRELRAKV